MMRHYFHSKVWQPESLTKVTIPSSRDLLPIKFQLFKVTRSSGWTEEEEEEDGNVTCEELEEEPKLVAEKQTKPLSRSQLLYLWTTQDTTGILSGMGVPQDEQPAIVVAKIFETLKIAVHFRPIYVVIEDIVTVRVRARRGASDESWNKVRFDCLEPKKEEEEEEEEELCVICLESITDFGPNGVTHLS